MSSTGQRSSAREASSPDWKLVGGRWLWWDGKQYTTEWDGASYLPLRTPRAKNVNTNANIGMILFAVTAVLLWVLGAFTGPVIVALGAQARRRAQEAGESTTFATVVIVLGVISFILGLGMLLAVSSPDFEM
jgi:hypothetical protein